MSEDLNSFERTKKSNDAESARLAIELRKLRYASTASDDNRPKPRPVDRSRYENTLQCSDGWRPDPKRRVASHWPRTIFDSVRLSYTNGRLSPDQQAAMDALGDKFRVRHLHRPLCGAVREVNAEEYCRLRGASAGSAYPLCEPCEADEPLRGPQVPPNMPSSWTKALSIAARRLKKSVDDLSFEQVCGAFTAK